MTKDTYKVCSTESISLKFTAIRSHNCLCLTNKVHIRKISEQGDTLDMMSWHYTLSYITMSVSGQAKQ